MEYREYARIIVRRGWIVVLLALLAAGAAYWVGERQTPVYEAGVDITVRPVRADWNLGQSVGMTLHSLAGDITTHTFLQQAIARAQIEALTSDALLSGKRLEVEVDPAAYTIAITVRDPDPHTAVRAANAIAALFGAQRQAWNERQVKENQVVVEVRDHARNARLYSPISRMYLAMGGALGAAIGAAIVAVVEWLYAGTVRSSRDVEELDLPVLGAIPPGSRGRG